MLMEKLILIAFTFACLFVFIMAIFETTTLLDRGERWRCARYRAES